jgi:hypothetical protein
MSIEQLREAGRKRAQAFTPEYQAEMGRRRAQQKSFVEHNRRIAPDGFSAQSAYMRGPSGLRLLRPEHIQFLEPSQLRGPGGSLLSHDQQRLFFGLYVWRSLWDGLPQPALPTDEEFLARGMVVRDRLHYGHGLENLLDVIYVAACDFCDASGHAWSWKKQRRLFRQALAAGRQFAEKLTADQHKWALADRMVQPRQLGVRRPMSVTPVPTFVHQGAAPQGFEYGRPDLPSYHLYNILPQRPYGVPTTNDSHPVYWLPVPKIHDLEVQG